MIIMREKDYQTIGIDSLLSVFSLCGLAGQCCQKQYPKVMSKEWNLVVTSVFNIVYLLMFVKSIE